MKKINPYLIKPIQVFIDILIINLIIYILCDGNYLNTSFITYISFYWILSSLLSGFYNVYRYTIFLRLLNLLVRQFLFFTIGFFAFFGIFREGSVVNNQFLTLSLILICISVIKILYFFLIKKLRANGKDNKKTIIIGFDSSALKIIKLFNDKPDLGYHFLGFFSDEKNQENRYLGVINDSFEYVKTNEVHEIYACISMLKRDQIKKITKFANQYNIQLKLVPNASELFNKNREVEFYNDSLRVFKIKKMPFEIIENRLVKRFFDIVFSSFVILFLMSWLTPILWVLIKLESKGPLLFKQDREGLNGDKFLCFKFRSMRQNNLNLHATKNDTRVTKIGAFIRKTSIDELPQFFNVFIGDMSVVGPRPHMRALAIEYQKEVDFYTDRHAVKPGITGLAQVSGYRGEIKIPNDIINRIRFDIFYIENWSFLFDIKIIIRTILNVFYGDDKAY